MFGGWQWAKTRPMRWVMVRHPGVTGPPVALTVLVALAALTLAGCPNGAGGDGGPAGPILVAPDGPGGPGPGDPDGGTDPTNPDGGTGPDGPAFDGAAIYAAQCATCHGVRGEGLSAPRLDRWTRPESALVTAIADRMPLEDPTLCEAGGCAEAVADFILTSLQRAEGAGLCDAVDVTSPELLAPRTLRLLTRDEYRRTVTALLHPAAEPCGGNDDCALDEVCGDGCTPLPCGTTTFAWDPPGAGPGATRVHVAGSFNGWPATVGAGAAMTWEPALGLWVARVNTGTGRHEYKFVVDERDWLSDPLATQSVSDGFGGSNSVRDVQCDANAGNGAAVGDSAVDFAANLPGDAHPARFPFSSHAASGVVTAIHVEEYLRAAEAALVDVDVMALVHCAPSPSCTRATIAEFGRRAFRRPLGTVEVDRYAALAADDATFAGGITTAVAALLSSPAFLYRSELGVDDGNGVFHLDAWETATLLAFTLTGMGPDDALLDAAAAGNLDGPDSDVAVRLQAERLLATPAARQTLGAFAQQWLGAERVLTADKNPGLFPGFTSAVRRDLFGESAALFSSVMFDGSGRFNDLLSSRQGFVSSRTAGLYGLTSTSQTLEPVTLPEARRGLLSLASVLSGTAHSDQTSPILRGLFVREVLLCQPLPPPPPNAGGVPDVDPNATTRERFAQHTANPFCASCHQSIDPIGFGFEAFDAIGRSRSVDSGRPVDSAGDMVDLDGIGSGTSAPFHSMAEFAAILSSSDVPKRCFVTQAGRYTLGRELEHDEACLFDAAATAFAASDGDLRTAFTEIVASDAFRARSEP